MISVRVEDLAFYAGDAIIRPATGILSGRQIGNVARLRSFDYT